MKNLAEIAEIERKEEHDRLVEEVKTLKAALAKERSKITRLKRKSELLLEAFEIKKQKKTANNSLYGCNLCGNRCELKPIVRPAGDTISVCSQCKSTCLFCYQDYIQEDLYMHCLCGL